MLMNKLAVVLCVVSLMPDLLAAQSLWTDGNPKAGQKKAATCAACHGADGNSVNPLWPKLAGQHAPYIVEQLKAFKDGERVDPLMSPQAQKLSEQDMEDLAAYFSQQTTQIDSTDVAAYELGAQIYRGGNLETGVPACMACHGPAGQGNPAAGFPKLAGQQPDYVAAELRAYRSGKRDTGELRMMQTVTERMTDKEITAVAQYIAGLHYSRGRQ